MGGEEIIVKSLVVFDGIAEDLQIEETLTAPASTTSCDAEYNGYSLTAVYDNATKDFTLTKAGDETLLNENTLLWTNTCVNPFDNNNSGISYTHPVTGEGMFIGAWKIQKGDCPAIILYADVFGKRAVEVCNILESISRIRLLKCASLNVLFLLALIFNVLELP